MNENHELVQNIMLPREINFISYQGCWEEKWVKIKTILNAIIISKLVRQIMDMH